MDHTGLDTFIRNVGNYSTTQRQAAADLNHQLHRWESSETLHLLGVLYELKKKD